jgi:hypothetical protein
LPKEFTTASEVAMRVIANRSTTLSFRPRQWPKAELKTGFESLGQVAPMLLLTPQALVLTIE